MNTKLQQLSQKENWIIFTIKGMIAFLASQKAFLFRLELEKEKEKILDEYIQDAMSGLYLVINIIKDAQEARQMERLK